MKREERVWIAAWAAMLGFGLLMLHNWIDRPDKPDANFELIWPAYVMVVSLPLTLQMLSRYRREKLLWLLTAGFSLVMAGAAAFVGQHVWVDGLPRFSYSTAAFLMAFIVATCWFILMPFGEHKLIRQQWCDDYSLLYAAAWRNIFKLASAVIFVGLFWGLLFLWAGLFNILKVNFFYELFTDRNFAYPITSIAFGLGLSLYSAKEEMLAGVYRACLNILGWLLPLVTFILLLFLLALLFQGLTPLWNTGYATSLMLTLLGLTVFLFNAAWQDGRGADKFPKWLLEVISLGFVAMPLYIGLCAHALSLRIVQHGWSIERIWAALAISMLGIYAVGYAITALRRQTCWMLGAKSINITGALTIVILLVLTCTPVLNPARIAVDSQVGRLLTNKITVDAFDFDYLRFEAGKYGNDSLKKLLGNYSHPQTALIHEKVESSLSKKYRYESRASEQFTFDPEKLAAKLKVYPAGIALDTAFIVYFANELNTHKFGLNCLNDTQLCQMLAIDLNADGQNELVLFDRYQSKVFALENGIWNQRGILIGPTHLLGGASLTGYLEKQDVETPRHKWRDIRIGSDMYEIENVRQ